MIKDLITSGMLAQIAKQEEQEKTNIGNLRAGNTGMINTDGDIIGSCAAEAYLRMKGISMMKNNVNQELMFSSGRGNETLWVDSLKEAWNKPGQIILQEQETATGWQTETKTDIKVTGRPDIVLQENGKNIVGIELKQVMSSYTATAMLINKEPFLKHLMQMAHYMFALDIPFELWYTNRTKIDIPEYMTYNKKMPRPGEKLSEYFDYNYYRLGKEHYKTGKPTKHKLVNYQAFLDEKAKGNDVRAEPKKYRPFMTGFLAQFQNEQLYIKQAEDPRAPWLKTIVNISDIKRFYNYISEIELSGKVPRKYLNLTYLGEELKFSFESPLEELSPEYWAGKSLDVWMKQVKRKFDIKD